MRWLDRRATSDGRGRSGTDEFLSAIAAAFAALTGPGAAGDGFEAAQRDGVVVFSQRVGERFRLVEQRARRPIRALPVALSATPFDVEVGRDQSRRLVVAFARCQSAARSTSNGSDARAGSGS